MAEQTLVKALCAGVLLAFPAVPARADEAAPIIVTAQRREQDAARVPASTTVIAGDAIGAAGIRDAAELAERVPGLTLARSFRGPPIYSLRGIGFDSPNMSATSPVAFMADELALPYPVMTEGPLFDLERIEVVKGPQGTLFGRNTTGGIVNAIARKPSADTTGYLRLSGGGHSAYGAEGALGGALADGLAARAAFSIDRADKGWQRHVDTGARLGQRRRSAARLAVNWQPAPDVALRLTGNWWHDGSDTQAPQAVELYPFGLIAAGFGPADWAAAASALGLPADFAAQPFRPADATQARWATAELPWGNTAFAPPPRAFRKDNTFTSAALRGEWRLSPAVTLISLTGYARLDRDETTDNAGWAYENALTRGQGRIESLTQELRLAGSGNRLDWSIGAHIARDTVEDRDTAWVGSNSTLQVFRLAAAGFAAAAGADAQAVANALNGFRDYANDTRQTVRSWTMFGQAEFRPVPAVGLTAGLRYTADRTSFSGCSRDLGDGSMAAAVNAFYPGIGIPSAVAPGGCITFLGDLSAAVASGGAIPLPPQGLFRARLAEENLSGRLAIEWRAADAVMLYASAARGFRAGTFPNIEGNVAVQYAPARQERVLAFEAGVKARIGRWLAVEAAAFRSNYTDKQVFGGIPDIVFGSLNRVLNVPKSHVQGVEASASARLPGGFTLAAEVSWIATRIDRFAALDAFGTPRDFAGARFAHVPGFQSRTRVEKTVPLGSGWTATADAAWHHASAHASDPGGDPRFRVPTRDIVDAGLALSSPAKAWTLALRVRNLTDAYYWNAVTLPGDSFNRYAGAPRDWTLALTRTF